MKKEDVVEGMNITWTGQTWPKRERVAMKGKVIRKGVRKVRIETDDGVRRWTTYNTIDRG